MRYKNLTITITLGVLSMVAVVGLVLMPISNGICEWTGNKGNKSYSNTLLDDDEQGWDLSISLSANSNSASASVTPSIHSVGVFTSEKTYSGTANIKAYRNSGHKWDWVYCSYNNGCENYHNCPGHQQVVSFAAATDNPSKVIYTTVDMAEVMTVWGQEKSLITRKYIGATVDITVGIDKYASMTQGGKAYVWRQNGKKYWETSSKKTTNPIAGASEGISASVVNYKSGDSGAEILSLSFEDPTDPNPDNDFSTTNSVSYTGVPIRPRTPR